MGLFHVPPEGLKQLLVALQRLDYRPGQAWLYYYAQMVRFWWTSMSNQQFGIVFRTLAAMGHKPDSVWWSDMLARLQCRCDSLDAQVGGGCRAVCSLQWRCLCWGVGCCCCMLPLPSTPH